MANLFVKGDNTNLVFIKSKNIKVFPCGRRKSLLVDLDGGDNTVNDRYYIPFDPEARLNTEANNRKHSGLNGYKQSYLLNWKSNGYISLVLAGYLFEIASGMNPAEFGTALSEAIASNTSSKSTNKSIFVNIKLADMSLLAEKDQVPAAKTKILRDQVTNQQPLPGLDIFRLIDTDSKNPTEDPNNYYFCGLSFSHYTYTDDDKTAWVSLQLLDSDGNTWKIHEASRLPVIEHGDEENSVKIPGDLYLGDSNNKSDLHVSGDAYIDGKLTASDVIIKSANGDEQHAITMKIVEVIENDVSKWQLQFNGATEIDSLGQQIN